MSHGGSLERRSSALANTPPQRALRPHACRARAMFKPARPPPGSINRVPRRPHRRPPLDALDAPLAPLVGLQNARRYRQPRAHR